MQVNRSFTSEVFLIDETGKMLGKMPYASAKELARQKELDLVEINKQSGLSVCKIMDQGKWLYDQKKKQKHQPHVKQAKEMKFGMRIEKHDEDVKINHIKDFLKKGLDVRLVVEMSGREKAHPELAREKINNLLEALNGLIIYEDIRKNDQNLSVLIRSSKVSQ